MEQLQKRINDYRHGIVEEEKQKPKKAPSKRRTNKNKYFDEW
jgi:hypothetical protein